MTNYDNYPIRSRYFDNKTAGDLIKYQEYQVDVTGRGKLKRIYFGEDTQGEFDAYYQMLLEQEIMSVLSGKSDEEVIKLLFTLTAAKVERDIHGNLEYFRSLFLGTFVDITRLSMMSIDQVATALSLIEYNIFGSDTGLE